MYMRYSVIAMTGSMYIQGEDVFIGETISPLPARDDI